MAQKLRLIFLFRSPKEYSSFYLFPCFDNDIFRIQTKLKRVHFVNSQMNQTRIFSYQNLVDDSHLSDSFLSSAWQSFLKFQIHPISQRWEFVFSKKIQMNSIYYRISQKVLNQLTPKKPDLLGVVELKLTQWFLTFWTVIPRWFLSNLYVS